MRKRHGRKQKKALANGAKQQSYRPREIGITYEDETYTQHHPTDKGQTQNKPPPWLDCGGIIAWRKDLGRRHPGLQLVLYAVYAAVQTEER